MTPLSPSAATVEEIAQAAYGKLIAYLTARTGDLAAAEDALGDAFLAALKQWPLEGVPDHPTGWLMRTARRRQIDALRRQQTRDQSAATLQREMVLSSSEDDDSVIPDKRLALLFVCAHPAIDETARTPLCLQATMGIPTERIASAFLTAPTAMSQRLVRAKAKIRDARIPFRVPEPAEWPERLPCVLDTIYASFTTGWDDLETGPDDLATEAISLGRTLCMLAPNEPEALGLLALMLHCHARRSARRSEDGSFVPLNEQDSRLWEPSMIAEAEALLREAASFQRNGRYQLEAAIQSVHAQRRITGRTHWQVIITLYSSLIRLHPTQGARIAQAAAMCEAGNPVAALAQLDTLPAAMAQNHQPYWATRAHVLQRLGRTEDAAAARAHAAGLTSDPAVRAWLTRPVGSGTLHPSATPA